VINNIDYLNRLSGGSVSLMISDFLPPKILASTFSPEDDGILGILLIGGKYSGNIDITSCMILNGFADRYYHDLQRSFFQKAKKNLIRVIQHLPMNESTDDDDENENHIQRQHLEFPGTGDIYDGEVKLFRKSEDENGRVIDSEYLPHGFGIMKYGNGNTYWVKPSFLYYIKYIL
jgi:hypothetical protein